MLDEKFVSRSVALFCHDCRSAENHNKTNKDEDRGDGEHPPIDTDALGHDRLFHHGDTGHGGVYAWIFGPRLLSWFGFGRSCQVAGRLQLLRNAQRIDEFFEDASSMLVVLKLVKAGTGRCEQHDVACLGGLAGLTDSVIERLR